MNELDPSSGYGERDRSDRRYDGFTDLRDGEPGHPGRSRDPDHGYAGHDGPRRDHADRDPAGRASADRDAAGRAYVDRDQPVHGYAHRDEPGRGYADRDEPARASVDRDAAAREHADRGEPGHRRRVAPGRWPLAGLAAAVLGAVGSFILGWDPSEEATKAGTDAIYLEAGDHGRTIMVGASIGFLSVLALLVFAAGFTRLAARRAPDSLTVPAMRLAFAGAVGCLIFSFGLKHALAGGVPGGIDASFYTKSDVEVLTLIVSQMQYAAWWGVIAAAACAAVLTLAHRVLPTWFGIVSALLATISIAATVFVGLPYSAGLLAPVWMVAASIAVLRLRDREL